MSWIQVLVIGYLVAFCHGSDDDSPILRSIEGKVEVEGLGTAEALTTNSAVVVDGGRYIGFLKHSGEFEIVDVPPGTYLVEVISPNYVFDPVRVDISAKSGKIRARKVDLLKMSSVSHLPYPLRFKSSKPAQFFEKREQWNIVDTLKNPTVSLNDVHNSIVLGRYKGRKWRDFLKHTHKFRGVSVDFPILALHLYSDFTCYLWLALTADKKTPNAQYLQYICCHPTTRRIVMSRAPELSILTLEQVTHKVV